MFSIWSGTHQGMDHRYQHPHLSPYPHPNYHPVPSVDDIGGSSEVHTSKENFLVKVDTRNFGPEQLLVKTLDGFLIVEGEHEERSEAAGHRFTTRKFARRFLLPVNCKEDELRCEIHSFRNSPPSRKCRPSRSSTWRRTLGRHYLGFRD